jgi:hypothetical protein
MTERVNNEACPGCGHIPDADGLCECGLTPEDKELLELLEKETDEELKKLRHESEEARAFLRAELLEALIEARPSGTSTGHRRNGDDDDGDLIGLPGWEDPLQVCATSTRVPRS